MTQAQRQWSRARDGLVDAVTSLGYPEELAELMARQLGSPKAIDRMTSYIHLAHPTSEEMLVDEMLAICSEIDAWRSRKESLDAQAAYSRMLYYGELGRDDDDDV